MRQSLASHSLSYAKNSRESNNIENVKIFQNRIKRLRILIIFHCY